MVINGKHLILLVLYATIVFFFQINAQPTCQGYTRLEFHDNAEPEGLISYITAPFQPVPYVAGTPIPQNIVVNVVSPEVVDPLSDIGGKQLDTRLDGLSIGITSKPDTYLSGNVVNIVRGRAIFSALTLYDVPDSSRPVVTLVFALSLANGTVLSLETGPITPVADPSSPVSVRWANFGFIIRPTQPLTLPMTRGATGIYPFARIEPLSANGKVITDAAFTIVAQCTIGMLDLDGDSQISVSAGSTIDIFLNHVGGSPNDVPLCRFNVSTATWSRVLTTGPITLVSAAQRSRFMFFDQGTSYIKYNNQGGSSALGVPLPSVVIKLYTSNLEFDPSNSGLVITAHSLQAELSGGEAVVVRGVATFKELRFVGTAIDNAVITFVAGSQGNLAVAGAVLYSGPMSVSITTVKKSQLAFSPLSDVQEGVPIKIKLQGREFTLPNIVVVVKDSAGQFDSTANNIGLEIGFEGNAPATTLQLYRRVVGGIAAWSDLTLVNNQKITFRIRVSDDSDAIATRLYSGLITVQPELYTTEAEATSYFDLCVNAAPSGAVTPPCIFSARFANEYTTFSSHVYEEDQPMFTTVGGRIPTIRVELRDGFGVTANRVGLTSATVPALFVMTGSDPRSEELLVRGGSRDVDTGSRIQGIFKNGVYEFSCLEFASIPAGLIRLRFAAYRVVNGKITTQYLGINALQSGFVTVTATPVPTFALRFDNSYSLIVYPGQINTGAANIALPPITVVMVDSDNQPDYTGSGFVVTVSPTSGAIDSSGSREIVRNGRAIFSNIKFTDLGNEPKLTFRASQTDEPVLGKSVSSGVFVLASLPIAFFEIAFPSTRNEFADITYEFQTMTFANFSVATFKVSVFVRDSAHQVHSSNGGNTISIEAYSDEGQIENADGGLIVALDSRCTCANYTTRITRGTTQYPAGTAIYVKYRVKEGPSLLIGKQLVVGPIIIESELRSTSTAAASSSGSSSSSTTAAPGASSSSSSSGSSQSCEASIITPIVLGEFRMSPSRFGADKEKIRSALATKLGIENSRVTILDDFKAIKRRDFDTGGEWDGTLARMIFSNPFPTSTNTRTSTQLASEFVKLRPQCDEIELNLQTAYYEEEVKTCDVAAFRASLTAAQSCAARLFIPSCQCYDEGPAAIWGFPCQEDPAAQALLVEMCAATVDCAEASITAVCSGLVSALTTNLAWLWAIIGTVVALVMVVLVLRKQGVTFGVRKLTLNFYDKFRGHRPDPYEVEKVKHNDDD